MNASRPSTRAKTLFVALATTIAARRTFSRTNDGLQYPLPIRPRPKRTPFADLDRSTARMSSHSSPSPKCPGG